MLLSGMRAGVAQAISARDVDLAGIRSVINLGQAIEAAQRG